MPKTAKPVVARVRYTPEEDALIKRLGKKDWATYEVSYRLYKQFGSLREHDAIGQRRTRLIAEGNLTSRPLGKRFVTQEAMDWYNKMFGTSLKPCPMLSLSEEKPHTKNSAARRKVKADKPELLKNGSVSRMEILGFTKAREERGPRPTYMVKALRIQRHDPDILGLFRDFLETAVSEGKTAVDVLDDLKLAAQ